MTNRKAIVKGTIKISFIVAVLAALGFLVFNYVIPVLAAHTSTAVVTPSVVQGGTTNVLFTAVITNTGGSPISEFRIYNNTVAQNPDGVSPFTNLVCDSADGWNGPFYIPGVLPFCQYTAKTVDDYIEPTESKTFTFSFDVPTQPSTRTIQLETRDPDQFYTPLPVNISVDGTPPVTTKSFNGPQKNDEGVEWIDGVTQVVLNPTDPEPHPSGVDKTWYMNILAEDAVEQLQLQVDPELPCRDQNFCNVVLNKIKNNLDNPYFDDKWQLYTEPFQKDEESCHVLVYYSVDEIGNEEDMKVNCFFVDKTPPVLTKDVGKPSVDETNEEEVGNGWVMWTTSDYYSSLSAAKLYVLDGTEDWAGVDVSVDIALEDINSLSFWELIESYGLPMGWSVNVILGVDADGDGVFESDLDGWHIGPDSWTLEALNGDTFVEMDGAVGPNPATGVWMNTDAYNTPQWWTPDESGAGFAKSDTYPWTFYDTFDKLINVFIPDSTQTSLIPNTNARVKLIKLVIGGSGSWNYETAIVDDLSLNGNVILSEITLDRFSLVSPVTPITFSCSDPEPHPSDDEELCFKVSYDKDPFDLTSLYAAKYQTTVGPDGFACILVDEYDKFIFNFNTDEDSVHDLEYYCKDAVEKKSETFLQWYKVDTESPVITKEMFGSWLGDCPPNPEPSDDQCYVADDGSSGVSISVQDIGHAAELGAECYYELWWEGQSIQSGYFNDYQEITFYQDSTHTLKIWCQDALDNPVYDEEEFLVDSTPPETTKTYGEPFVEDNFPKGCYEWDNGYNGNGDNGYRCGWAEWITSNTPISLGATDEKVGVDKIFWRNLLVTDPDAAYNICGHLSGDGFYDYCNPEFYYRYVNPETPWDEYTGPFYKPEESCHIIEYYSVDELGNKEDLNWQCVFVDNTEPEVWKEVGEPKVEGEEGVFYISQETPITLFCADVYPHPVDHVSLWYRYRVSEDCENWGEWTDWEDPNGYVAEKTIYFEQDSCHELEYYCEDGLGNVGPIQTEIDIVDTQSPVITKEIVGPQYGDCPPNGEGDCYIDGVTEIYVDVYDPDPHPVNDVTCDWYYEVTDNGASGGEQDVTPPFVINFPEESTHDLTITCRDALGNEASDKEIFIVDKTPPETTKTYEGPQYPEQGYPKWITSDTNVTLEATDDVGPHDSGVKATYWRNTLVADENCWEEELCQQATGSGEWNLYADPFNKGEESCHLIEYYSVDNVNKTEEVNKQCVFVDNSPPTPNKTVKEPREEWYPTTDLLDPDRTNFYPEIVDKCWNGEEDRIECWKITTMTPIKLDCTDPEPHPVDRETVFFMVGLDGEDVTQDYCDNEGGNYNEETGWCEVSGEEAPVWFKFKEETEHNLKYYCEDALGNAGPIDEEKFKVEGEKFKIDLNKKWNLISVPFRLLDGAMDKVWNDTAEEVITVWTYDPLNEMCGTDWCVYTPDGVENDNLNTMLPGWGYWVLANENAQLLVGGSLFSPIIIPSSKEMVNGWNLIGYYGIEDDEGNEIKKYEGPDLDGDGKPAICALGSLVNTVLGNPKWSALVNYWEPYNPNQWVFLNQFNYMNPGAGYWLELDLDPNEEEFYSFSTTCPIFP